MNNLIGISGFARSGKDTFYRSCSSLLSSRGESVKRYSFADALKQELDSVLIKYTGISAFTEKDEEKNIIRPLLVTYGTEVRRKLNPNCWIDKINLGVDFHLQSGDYVFITDVRFLNEAEWIKSKGGKLINIKRDEVGAANKDEINQYNLFNHLIDHSISWPNFDEENIFKLDVYACVFLDKFFPNLNFSKKLV
ncbi:hypothetical protein EB151_14500 [archaeon]|nr:hypothetical protein [archaeon]